MRKRRQGEKHNVTAPGGDIIASSAREFRRRLWFLMDEEARRIVVDLTGVGMIDSTGTGTSG
ncbi:MAG TPA: STAS domain-containing protein [Syntrophales bacterium]|jgi:anti-anti-sigma regulatory factor|nr:STAS domain-containing protein [Syntrophales bacterium]HRT61121.1 STAS domain-containing protein [Syntrophales bacterium]